MITFSSFKSYLENLPSGSLATAYNDYPQYSIVIELFEAGECIDEQLFNFCNDNN